MSIYRGDRKIASIYRGNRKITKIYRGDRQVFDNTTQEEMTYIYSRTTYDLFLVSTPLSTDTDKYEIKMSIAEIHHTTFVRHSTRCLFQLFVSSAVQQTRLWFGRVLGASFSVPTLNEIATYSYDKTGFYKNGTKVGDINYQSYEGEHSLSIGFWENNNKVYYLKRYTNGVLVNHFIPIKQGSLYGFYDLITGTKVLNSNLVGVKEN